LGMGWFGYGGMVNGGVMGIGDGVMVDGGCVGSMHSQHSSKIKAVRVGQCSRGSAVREGQHSSAVGLHTQDSLVRSSSCCIRHWWWELNTHSTPHSTGHSSV
jgi:hypothetical protein